MTKEKKLSLLILIVIIGLFSSIAFHYGISTSQGLGYPYNTFLFRPDDRFMDFINPLTSSFELDPYNPINTVYVGGYLPFAYVITFLISQIRPWEAALWIFLIGFIFYLWMYICRTLFLSKPLTNQDLLVLFCLTFMTYPVLFSIDRANFDILIFILISLFVYFYQKQKFTLSAVILALPIAMKGYPLALSVFFLLDRRWREFIFSIALVAALEIGSLSIFSGGLFVEYGRMTTALQTAVQLAFVQGVLMRFNSSLYVLIMFISKNIIPGLSQIALFNYAYTGVMVCLFLLVCVYMVRKKFPFWRQLLLIMTMMILFPQSSGDYRLLLIYPPMLLFLAEKERFSSDKWIVVIFGLLLIPKAYIVLESDANIGIILNPLLLIAFLVVNLLPVRNETLTQDVEQKMTVPKGTTPLKFKLSVLVLVAGFGLALLASNISGNSPTPKGYPFNTFLFRPESRFLDFIYPYSIARDPFINLRNLAPPTNNLFSFPQIIDGLTWQNNSSGPLYFPFAYWLVVPFTQFSAGLGLLLYWVITAIIFSFAGLLLLPKKTNRIYLFLICLLSYPFWFLIDRSNFEIFSFLFLLLFFYYYETKPVPSALALGCAIGMKFVPIWFLLLLLSDKKYREILIALGLAFILNVAAYSFYPGGLFENIYYHLLNLRSSSSIYILDGRDMAFNSDIQTGIKYLILAMSGQIDLSQVAEQGGQISRWIETALILMIVAQFYLYKMELWKKATLLTCAILLFSPSSGDYRLILLYLPFYLWLASPNNLIEDILFAVIFGLLFIPKAYLHIPAFPEISASTFFNPLLMVIATLVIFFKNAQNQDFRFTGTSKWEKYWIPISAAAILIGILLFPLVSRASQKTMAPSIAQQLRTLAHSDEASKRYASALGYYTQWFLLEPENTEVLLGLGRAYLETNSELEAYQLYRRLLTKSNLTPQQFLEVKAGYETGVNNNFCRMVSVQEYQWSEMLRMEYLSKFPDQTGTSIFSCTKSN